MKIFKLEFDVNNYKSLQLCESVDVSFYQMFDGTRLSDDWSIPKVKYYEEDKKLREGDAPGFKIPVFNQRALDILFPLIQNDVEILPLDFKEEKMYGINVINVIDGLDHDNSEYITFGKNDKILMIKKYAFNNEVIRDNSIFKLTDYRLGDILVSEEFYTAVNINGLQGFKMQLVYDNETDVKPQNKNDIKNQYSYYEELDSDTLKEIIDNYRYAMNKFEISNDDHSKAVKQLYDIVEEKKYKSLIPKSFDDVEDATVALGVLYGQLICDSYGWKWKAVGDSAENYYISVVSPNEYFCVFPLHYMNRVVSGKNIGLDGNNDNTIILLYNMLANVEDNPKEVKLYPLG